MVLELDRLNELDHVARLGLDEICLLLVEAGVEVSILIFCPVGHGLDDGLLSRAPILDKSLETLRARGQRERGVKAGETRLYLCADDKVQHRVKSEERISSPALPADVNDSDITAVVDGLVHFRRELLELRDRTLHLLLEKIALGGANKCTVLC